MISVGSEVQVLPGPYFSFDKSKEKYPPEGERSDLRGAAAQCGVSMARLALLLSEWLWTDWCGGLAQLVEHLLCKQGVSGSNPLASISP